MLGQPGGARVLTVLSTELAPIPRDQARPAIQAFLTNERKRQAVHEALKTARASAHIQYTGPYAPAASQPGAAASAPL